MRGRREDRREEEGRQKSGGEKTDERREKTEEKERIPIIDSRQNANFLTYQSWEEERERETREGGEREEERRQMRGRREDRREGGENRRRREDSREGENPNYWFSPKWQFLTYESWEEERERQEREERREGGEKTEEREERGEKEGRGEKTDEESQFLIYAKMTTYNISIVVPSTRNVNEIITDAEHKFYVEFIAQQLSRLAGGATTIPGYGILSIFLPLSFPFPPFRPFLFFFFFFFL
jgi:hypothetical protein